MANAVFGQLARTRLKLVHHMGTTMESAELRSADLSAAKLPEGQNSDALAFSTQAMREGLAALTAGRAADVAATSEREPATLAARRCRA